MYFKRREAAVMTYVEFNDFGEKLCQVGRLGQNGPTVAGGVARAVDVFEAGKGSGRDLTDALASTGEVLALGNIVVFQIFLERLAEIVKVSLGDLGGTILNGVDAALADDFRAGVRSILLERLLRRVMEDDGTTMDVIQRHVLWSA